MNQWEVVTGDCVEVLAGLAAGSLDACVTDPPYDLISGSRGGSGRSNEPDNPHGLHGSRGGGFMGLAWDATGVSFRPETWREVYRVLKPGAHLLAFGGTRTFHRLTCAIEDAGWEIRDTLMFLHGQGFPKSLNVNKNSCFCQCGPLPYSHAGNSVVRDLREGDSEAPVSGAEGDGALLLAGVQRGPARAGVGEARSQGAQGPDTRELPASSRENERRTEPGMEGRGDVLPQEGELLHAGDSLRPSARVGEADGAEGRLHHGAPPQDGGSDRAPARPNGSRASSEPRPLRQSAGESRTLAVQQPTQTRGAWPTCDGCGKPRIPPGLGTALKPSFEPIILARKPFKGTVAQNVAEHGTGALNVDGCRIPTDERYSITAASDFAGDGGWGNAPRESHVSGRWPANVLLDENAARMLDEQSGELPSGLMRAGTQRSQGGGYHGNFPGEATAHDTPGDSGGASRFFYTSKASRSEREAGLEGAPWRTGAEAVDRAEGSAGLNSPRAGAGRTAGRIRNFHPTVKPVDLMCWLCRLVTPPGGTVLDPFAGSGTTGLAALRCGFGFYGVEREAEYAEIARERIRGDAPLFNSGG